MADQTTQTTEQAIRFQSPQYQNILCEKAPKHLKAPTNLKAPKNLKAPTSLKAPKNLKGSKALKHQTKVNTFYVTS